MSEQKSGGAILSMFLCIQNLLKVYHLQTTSYARHKASDKLYKILIEKFDQYMEVYQGKYGRVDLSTVESLPVSNVSDKQMDEMLHYFYRWITKLHSDNDNDLQNIRDEIMSEISRCIYLFSLS